MSIRPCDLMSVIEHDRIRCKLQTCMCDVMGYRELGKCIA